VAGFVGILPIFLPIAPVRGKGSTCFICDSRIANETVTKPQDILVVLKLALSAQGGASFAALAKALGMSASEVHASVGRLEEARLLEGESRTVRRKPLLEFLLHGIPYAFPAAAGEMTRGMATAWAAPVMAGKFASNDVEAPVWPDPDGTKKGLAVEPLYSSAPVAAKNDPALYELLALVDALRLGRARERAIAGREIEQRLSHG
jgi:DNA-binding Lrp family transcriptional regulator